MTRGRKPKPASVHLLNGNPSKSSIEKRFEKETDATAIQIKTPPPAPDWFDDIAQEEWEKVTPLLMEIKVLTEADLSALEMYCKSYSRWKEAERTIDAVGSIMEVGKDGTYHQQRPEVAIATKYQKLCQGWMNEFGLTPSARARGVKADTEDINPMNHAFSDRL